MHCDRFQFENDVSIIVPVYNAEKWLKQCLDSISEQQFDCRLQVSIFDDSSADSSPKIIQNWIDSLNADSKIKVIFSRQTSGEPKGCGFAKNIAVRQSNSQYLCFLDSDDVMAANRVRTLFEIAVKYDSHKNLLIGSRFHRLPEDSTKRFTKWANSLSEYQLYTQIYTANGPTLLMPTWFCSRRVFDTLDGFDEGGKGVAEDLIFFYKHLDCGGKLMKIDEDLLMYRYHPQQTTFSVSEQTVWNLRLERFEKHVLNNWTHFSIWNAGKEGRRFFRSISDENRRKVSMFCDVDLKKITKGFYIYEESKDKPKPKVPIVHYLEAKPPFVICVKLDLTDGMFEANLSSLKLKEGHDYFHFG
ncbi:UDP-GlcNAc:betaGal beta-1:3-N-acetylglucosaminyltransferase-like protein 1 isoform X2 [Dinothrombium tinctorium]|uniref:UDP-GlcNAc:betaGal beta-1:3-N-acetylglucosaminyltransferase-like protein 1 isoform X2 n=1 Tax=Dinothrombium tinctorium TaxID=1965070 RepID=A0A3S3SG42_9ACAR|nr:UDP-GlcNAc:betaGal beta-1:3-N-acetylglucosaminyltransferase-like protein 1 isoform X2 [Dinothrombium tinctorium]RWS13597.1 UDP-GlcNAc:betaGal beta-1:3-N-acetylglucosaminyltransferase-like protein 1 isoform X2 [Dinothrombium tinctorium]RWS13636.1 UDP-GlcNAc:betaGal beta-1:3-N-acetylglucosaminyltransferase-like protein 1 isoform X2 [Dinothrombium tinctorium]